MKIEIFQSEPPFDTYNGLSREGKPFTKHTQKAYLHITGSPYPQPFKLSLQPNEHGNPVPYSPGIYTVCESSFYVNKYQDLALGRPKLILQAPSAPTQARQPAPAPAAQRAG